MYVIINENDLIGYEMKVKWLVYDVINVLINVYKIFFKFFDGSF